MSRILTFLHTAAAKTFFLLAENQTDALISELMKAQKAQNDPQKVLEEMEKERKEMEEMFTIKAGEADKLREKDVLSNHTRICQKFTLAIGTHKSRYKNCPLPQQLCPGQCSYFGH